MPRPEKPLNCTPAREALAQCLRSIRTAVGATYSEMAAAGGIPPATLKRIASAAGGVPKWENVTSYHDICLELARRNDLFLAAATGRQLRDLWVKARKEERGTLDWRAPHTDLLRNAADLGYALRVLYEDAGAPPLRELQTKAGGPVNLPLSSASLIIKRKMLPSDTRQFTAFVKGCGVSDRSFKKWSEAWYRVMLDTPIRTFTFMGESEEERLIRINLGRKYFKEAAGALDPLPRTP